MTPQIVQNPPFGQLVYGPFSPMFPNASQEKIILSTQMAPQVHTSMSYGSPIRYLTIPIYHPYFPFPSPPSSHRMPHVRVNLVQPSPT